MHTRFKQNWGALRKMRVIFHTLFVSIYKLLTYSGKMKHVFLKAFHVILLTRNLVQVFIYHGKYSIQYSNQIVFNMYRIVTMSIFIQ